MNFSNHKKSRKKSSTNGTIVPNTNLVTARVGIFYGLEYKKSLTNKVSTVSGLVATPNIVFNNSETSAFFDFSDWKNVSSTENDFLNFWKNVPVGSTFTVSNAELYNEKNGNKYDLSGVYTLNELENLIVFCTVNSVTNKDSDMNLYSKKHFKQTPIFHFNSVPSSDNDSRYTFIVNHFGQNTKTSFTYLGAAAGDHLLIQGEESSYEIENINIDSEGKEIIKIKGSLLEENRIGTKTLIQLKIKIPPNSSTDDIDINDSKIGSCLIGNACFNNQSESQCKLRQIKNVSLKFTENNECVNVTPLTGPPKEISYVEPSSEEVMARLLNDISKNISSNSKSGKIF
jgi:hypothetical protein